MKIILADDHALFRDGLRHLLLRLDEDVSILEAESHDTTLQVLDANPDADLALIDLHMHGRSDDLAGLTEILERARTVPVVVISGSEDVDEILRIIQMGTMGFIPKLEHADVMLCALRLVLSGGVYVPPMLASLATGTPPHHSRLTLKQVEVLKLLGDGLSNKEICKIMKVTESTVKCHTTAIFRELDVASRTQAVAVAKQLHLIG